MGGNTKYRPRYASSIRELFRAIQFGTQSRGGQPSSSIYAVTKEPVREGLAHKKGDWIFPSAGDQRPWIQRRPERPMQPLYSREEIVRTFGADAENGTTVRIDINRSGPAN